MLLPTDALDESAAKEEYGHGGGDKPFWQIWDFWTAAGTIILAVATIGLAWKTDGLIKSAEESARQQLRAHVGILSGSVKLHPIGMDGGKIKATLKIKNFGQTPALNCRIEGNMGIAFSFSELKSTTIKPIGAGAILFPTTENTAYVPCDMENITEGNGPIQVFVFGRIQYRDIFKVERETTFRFSAVPTSGDDRMGLEPCEEGNSAT